MPSFAGRLTSVILALSLATQPAGADYYFRLRGSLPGLPAARPDSSTDTVLGTGELRMYGPLQVRGRPGIAFNLPILAESAGRPVTWSSVGDALPPGLSLDPATGVISGRPMAVGESSGIMIQGTAGGVTGTTQPFTIAVRPLPTVTVDVGTNLAPGRRGAIVPSAGSVFGTYNWRLAGDLPSGMSLNASDGVISGVPDVPGSYPGLVLTVTDADGASGASAPFAVRLASTIAVTGFDGAYATRRDAPFTTIQPAAVGARNPVTWELSPVGGPLPDGLALDAYTGVVSGRATKPGTYGPVVVRARDTATGEIAASGPITFAVGGAPALAYPTTTRARVSDKRFSLTPTPSGLLAGGYYGFSGALPLGTALDPATGEVSGQLTSPGLSTGLVGRVTDMFDGAVGASPPFDIDVAQALSFANPVIPALQVGQPFAMTPPPLQGLRGVAGYNLGGTLPPGLSYDAATGTVSGTPSLAGTWTAQYYATDPWDGAFARTSMIDLTVRPPPTVVPFAVQPLYPSYGAVVGTPLAVAPYAIGAKGPVGWAVSANLPRWVSFDPATGRLSGTPDAPGTTGNVVLTATDAATGEVARSNALALVAYPVAPVSVSLQAVSGLVGQAFTSPNPTVSDAKGAVTFALASGALPDGTALDARTGIVAGYPSVIGDFPGISLRATDASGASAVSNAVTMTVRGNPILGTDAASASIPSVTAATVGTRLQAKARTSGLAQPVTWSLTAGTLPSWASLDAAAGTVSGIPTLGGTWDGLALEAVDADGVRARTNAFALTATAPSASRQLSVAMADVSAVVGSPLSVAPSASYATGALAWRLASGTLPPGVTVSATTGALSGSVTDAGTYPDLVLSATDATGVRASTGAFRITVSPPPLQPGTPGSLDVSAPNLIRGTRGVSLTTGASVATFSGALSWGVASGTLPPGLALASESGLISGTPTAAGTYGGLTLRVSDSAGASGQTGTFSFVITEPAVTTPATGETGTPGTTDPTTSPGSPAALAVAIATSGGTYGVPYSAAARTANANGAVTYSLAGGPLPSWARFDAAQGTITGTPDALGTTPGLRVFATDASGAVANTPPFSLTVTRPTLSVSGPGPVAGRATLPMTGPAPVAYGAIGRVTWRLVLPQAMAADGSGAVAQSLPPGLAFDPSTGVISGIPSAPAAIVGATLVALDSLGAGATGQAFPITIGGPPSASAPDVYGTRLNAAFSATPTASNLVGARSWVLAAGTLPSWASLDTATGTLSGKPDAMGRTEGLRLRVTDQGGASATTNAFAIAVATDLVATAPGSAFTARVGMQFAGVQPTVTGGAGGISWSLASGTLPAGLALDTGLGSIAGKPTAPAAATIALRATDRNGSTADTATFGVSVLPAATASAADRSGRTGAPFDMGPASADVRGPATWTLASGALPGWARLDAGTGHVSGVPDAVANTGGLSLRVVDADGSTAVTGQFSIAVTQGITVSGYASPYGNRADQAFPTATPSVSNALGTVSWSLASGTLPNGLSLSATTGAISGTPTAMGGFAPVVRATDASDGSSATAALSFTITQGLGILGTPGLLAHVNVPSATPALSLTAQRGTSVTWALASGSLPSWAKLNAGTGVISGTPTAVGTTSGLVLRATDGGDGSTVSTAPFSLQVVPALGVADVATSYLGRVGFPFQFSPPTAVNGVGTPTWSVGTGALPSWATLNATTGQVSGTPDAVANTTGISLRVVDQGGGTAPSVQFAINVAFDPIVTLSTTSVRVRVGDPVSVTVNATGLVGAAGWSANVKAGTLPDGLAVDPVTGKLSGIPTAPGSATVTLRVTDKADGRSVDSAPVTVVVNPALTVVPGSASLSTRQGIYLQKGPAATVTGAQGTVSYQLSVATPTGMSFDASKGILYGLPTASFAKQQVTLTAIDSADSKTASAAFSLAVVGPLAVSGTSGVSVRIGADAGATSFVPQAVNASTTGTVTWAKGGGTWPNGIGVDPATGKLTGKPVGYAAASTVLSPLVIVATDGDGTTAQSPSFGVTVLSPGLAVAAPAAQNARVGSPVAPASLSATGVTGGMTFAVTAGALPDGVAVRADGSLTGTPTTPGSYSATVAATDGGGATASAVVSYTVRPALTATPPSTSVSATVGTSVSFQVTSTGISGTPTWAAVVQSGALPAGLSLAPATGLLSGTVTATGVAQVAFRLTDSADGASVTSASVTVDGAPSFSIGSMPAQNLRIGKSASISPPVLGKAPGGVTWSVASGALSQGLSLDPATGVISGTPTGSSFSYNVSLKATATGQSVTSNVFTINANPALAFSNVSDKTLTVGVATGGTYLALASNVFGTGTLTLDGGVAPYAVSTGPTSVLITGVATAPMSVSGLKVTVTDSYDGSTLTSAPFSVSAAAIGTVPGQKARVGTPASIPSPGGTGFPGNIAWALDASSAPLPAGLSLNPATGAVSGTATATATGTIVLRGTSGPSSLTTSYDLTVKPALTAYNNPGTMNFAINAGAVQGYSAYVSGSQGTLTYSANQDLGPFSVVANSTNALIRGTAPSAGASYRNVVITATDAYDGATVSMDPFDIYVTGLTAPATQKLRIGTPYTSARPTATGMPGDVTWSASNLPPGLSIDQVTGVVSGTPAASALATAPGTPVGLVARSGEAVQQVGYYMIVNNPIQVRALTDQTLFVGTAADVNNNNVSNILGNATWTSNPPLGNGLTLRGNPSNVTVPEILGTPQSVQAYPGLTLTVTDSYDGANATTPPYNLYVVDMTVPARQYLRVGTPYVGPRPTATGFPGAVTWTAQGLPGGLAVDPATGVVSGTPTEVTPAAGYTVYLTAASGTASARLTYLVVSSAALTVTAQPDVSFKAYVNDVQSATGAVVTGGSPQINWTINGVPRADNNPISVGRNVQFNYYGALISTSGLQNKPKTYFGVTLTVTDPLDGVQATTPPFNLSILDITPPPLQRLRVGTAYTGPKPSASGFPGTITWSATGLAGGLAIDPATGVVAGNPTQATSGAQPVTLRATSGTATIATPYNIAVGGTLAIGTMPDIAFTLGQNTGISGPVVSGNSGALSWSTTPSIAPSYTTTNPGNALQVLLYGGNPSAVGSVPGVTITATDSYDQVKVTSAPFNVYYVRAYSQYGTPSLRVGTPYSGPAPKVEGLPGTVRWSVAPLPDGLAIDTATGALSGTPTTATAQSGVTLNYIARSTSPSGADLSTSFSSQIIVSAKLALTLQQDLTFLVGKAQSLSGATVSGNRFQAQWTFSPPVPFMSANGYNLATVSGTATGTGTYGPITMRATDPFDYAYVETAPFMVYAVQVTPPPTQNLRVGTAYAGPVPGTAGFPGTLTWTASNLPQGLSVDPATGAVGGTPTQASSGTTATLVATSGTASASVTYVINVGSKLAMGTRSDILFRTGINETYFTPTVSGNTSSVTWAASPSIAPATVAAQTSTAGAISGNNPSTTGAVTGVVLTARDQFDGATVSSNPFNVYFVSVANGTAPQGTKGTAYATGAPSLVGMPGTPQWSATGLPSTLAIDPNTGIISGTPTVAGSYNPVLMATSTSPNGTTLYAAPTNSMSIVIK